MIPDRVSISDRSKVIDKRKQYGHWEYDTMVSQKGCRGGISVGSERKSKLIVGNKVLSMSTTEHIDLIGKNTEIHKTLSITMDNGIENKGYQKLGIPTFFCDPYSSWQKGGVENANKMIRRYFPKGTNFNKVSKSSLDYVIKLINEKPRKILGYRSALEVAKKAGIIKSINSECPN